MADTLKSKAIARRNSEDSLRGYIRFSLSGPPGTSLRGVMVPFVREGESLELDRVRAAFYGPVVDLAKMVNALPPLKFLRGYCDRGEDPRDSSSRLLIPLSELELTDVRSKKIGQLLAPEYALPTVNGLGRREFVPQCTVALKDFPEDISNGLQRGDEFYISLMDERAVTLLTDLSKVHVPTPKVLRGVGIRKNYGQWSLRERRGY